MVRQAGRCRWIVCALLLLHSLAAGAASVIPLGLERLTQQSAIIFLGRCIDNRVARDTTTDAVVTYTRFEVLEAIKGRPGADYTIKQLGGNRPEENVFVTIPGIPAFRSGEEYVLFLPQPSKLGFSSPFGLEQGRFSVLPDDDNVKQVSNGRVIRDLLGKVPAHMIPLSISKAIQAEVGRPGQAREDRTRMALDDFFILVRSLQDGAQ
jgi:hypothetical protein